MCRSSTAALPDSSTSLRPAAADLASLSSASTGNVDPTGTTSCLARAPAPYGREPPPQKARRWRGYEAARCVGGDEQRAGQQREVGDGAGEVPSVEPPLDATGLEGVARGEDDWIRHHS